MFFGVDFEASSCEFWRIVLENAKSMKRGLGKVVKTSDLCNAVTARHTNGLCFVD